MSRKITALGAALATILTGAAAANAQTGSSGTVAAPSVELEKAFTAENINLLCEDGLARPTAVLGELAKNHSLNLFALPRRTEVLNRSIPDNAEARAVAWLIAIGDISAERAAARPISMPAAQHQALTAIRDEFARYLRDLRAAGPVQLYRAEGPAFSNDAVGDNAMLGAFFSETLGWGAAPVRILCQAPPVATITTASRGDSDRIPPAGPPIRPALRGKIDDLAVARGSSAYESASNATIAYTDNEEKGEQTIAVEATLGLGVNLTANDAIYGFVNYVQSETETRAADDDDESKDVQAASVGALYRRSQPLFNSRLFGTLGLTGYYTYDIENDAELVRGRLFLSDIAFNLPDQPITCGGAQVLVGRLLFNCRLGVFAEGGYILDAGRSVDLADNGDDQYFGAGFNARLALTLPSISLLSPLTLSAEFRYMEILTGSLNDPERLTLRADYKIAASNVSIGYSFEDGSNFETFQLEEVHKVTVGIRF